MSRMRPISRPRLAAESELLVARSSSWSIIQEDLTHACGGEHNHGEVQVVESIPDLGRTGDPAEEGRHLIRCFCEDVEQVRAQRWGRWSDR